MNSILITSNMLNLRAEYYPVNDSKYLLYEKNVNNTAYLSSAALPIVSVFYPIISKLGELESRIIYSNQNVRNSDLIDMIGFAETRSVDIDVFFTDNYHNLYPMFLEPGKQMSMRLAFIKQ